VLVLQQQVYLYPVVRTTLFSVFVGLATKCSKDVFMSCAAEKTGMKSGFSLPVVIYAEFVGAMLRFAF
jgi:hypothetical protein